MIEGVQVLSVYDTYTFDFNITAFFIAFILSINFVVLAKKYHIDNTSIIIILLISISMSLAIGIIVPTSKVQEYKVITSDDVSLNDFMETYDIIDIDGKIYTIREKEKE